MLGSEDDTADGEQNDDLAYEFRICSELQNDEDFIDPTVSGQLFDRNLLETGFRSDATKCGLTNLHNSCYENSILQMLFHTPVFVNYLNDDDFHRDTGSGNN